MGPKTRSSKSKPEWVVCPQTEVLHHSSDSILHQETLTKGILTIPSYPHVTHRRFRSTPEILEPDSVMRLKLEESMIQCSVFLPKPILTACGVGFSSWVIVSLPAGGRLVLRAFPHPSAEAKNVACLRSSWLGKVIDSRGSSQGMVNIEPFRLDVQKCQKVVIKSANDTKLPNTAGFTRDVKAHLVCKVIWDGLQLPFDYYGKDLLLALSIPGSRDQRSLSDSLANLSVSETNDRPGLTSTPFKQQAAAGKPAAAVKPAAATQYLTACDTTEVEVQRGQTVQSVVKTPRVGGLQAQLRLVCDSVGAIIGPTAVPGGRKPVNGILLFGPPGTGKTLLAQSVCHRFNVNYRVVAGPELYSKYYGETEAQIRSVFGEAVRSAPSILVLEELDTLAPRKEGGGSDQEKRVSATIQSLLDRIQQEQSRVAVIGTTNRLDNVSPSLRRPGRLDMELELGVPDVPSRKDILLTILEEMQHSLSDENIRLIAQETHGYVGADLSALLGYAMLKAQEAGREVRECDVTLARGQVKPSAMREVLVEVPAVTWQDIGGLDDLKLKLRQAVEWPIQRPEMFSRMGITPPRGVLMYGPPGCSKTMIAKALANESGLNFLSIKGPELFSKWVGESERAVREVFRRARAVAPSIVFFDEIDAIGAARGGGGGGKVGERVLAQLLTEMDGVVSLSGVVVVAATNRPDMMDRALLRPGRLDRVVYVPLPDLPTRRQILSVHTRKIPIKSVDLEGIAQQTDGYSGAELTAVCNEAALAALEDGDDTEFVTEEHFTRALAAVTPRIQPELLAIYDQFKKNQDKG